MLSQWQSDSCRRCLRENEPVDRGCCIGADLIFQVHFYSLSRLLIVVVFVVLTFASRIRALLPSSLTKVQGLWHVVTEGTVSLVIVFFILVQEILWERRRRGGRWVWFPLYILFSQAGYGRNL